MQTFEGSKKSSNSSKKSSNSLFNSSLSSKKSFNNGRANAVYGNWRGTEESDEKESETPVSCFSPDGEEIEAHELRHDELVKALMVVKVSRLKKDGTTKNISDKEAHVHLTFEEGKKQAQKPIALKGLAPFDWDQVIIDDYITSSEEEFLKDVKDKHPSGKKQGIYIFVQSKDEYSYRWLPDGKFDYDNRGHGSMVNQEERDKIYNRDKSFTVEFAGQFTSVDGEVVSWDNRSGHFAPPDANRAVIELPDDLYESNLNHTIEKNRDYITAATLCAIASMLQNKGYSKKLEDSIPTRAYGFMYPRWSSKAPRMSDEDVLAFLSSLTPLEVYDEEAFFEGNDFYIPNKAEVLGDVKVSLLKNIKSSIRYIVTAMKKQ